MRVKAWSIPQTRLDRLYQSLSEELEPAALRALRSGNYILGPEVERFERNFSAEIGTQFALGVGNGLDALTLALRGLGIGDGDEVIVPANTYIATLLAITVNGATPVLVEPDSTFNINPAKIEPAITERTRAVLVVHLYGRVCAMEEISAICRRRSLELIEDCAQSQGAGLTFSKDAPLTKSGNFGVAGCFSFYPTKNLGAYGDAGAVTTGSPELADRVRSLRNYGSEKRYYNREIGANSRLDELQAALLSVKLAHLSEINAERIRIAERYQRGIDHPALVKPPFLDDFSHIYHQYVLRAPDRQQRERLQTYLAERGIQTIVHYPIPPHLSEAYRFLGFARGDFPISEAFADQVLSIPIFNGMRDAEIDTVIAALNQFPL